MKRGVITFSTVEGGYEIKEYYSETARLGMEGAAVLVGVVYPERCDEMYFAGWQSFSITETYDTLPEQKNETGET